MEDNTKTSQQKRTEWIHIRLTPDELSKINQRYRKTPYRDLSTYLRKVLMAKPVTINTRNQSLDEFMQEMILLKNELSAVGSNLNQIAKRINSHATTPSVKLMMDGYRLVKDNVEDKIIAVKNKLNQFSELWLQGSSAEKASGEH